MLQESAIEMGPAPAWELDGTAVEIPSDPSQQERHDSHHIHRPDHTVAQVDFVNYAAPAAPLLDATPAPNPPSLTKYDNKQPVVYVEELPGDGVEDDAGSSTVMHSAVGSFDPHDDIDEEDEDQEEDEQTEFDDGLEVVPSFPDTADTDSLYAESVTGRKALKAPHNLSPIAQTPVDSNSSETSTASQAFRETLRRRHDQEFHRLSAQPATIQRDDDGGALRIHIPRSRYHPALRSNPSLDLPPAEKEVVVNEPAPPPPPEQPNMHWDDSRDDDPVPADTMKELVPMYTPPTRTGAVKKVSFEVDPPTNNVNSNPPSRGTKLPIRHPDPNDHYAYNPNNPTNATPSGSRTHRTNTTTTSSSRSEDPENSHSHNQNNPNGTHGRKLRDVRADLEARDRRRREHEAEMERVREDQKRERERRLAEEKESSKNLQKELVRYRKDVLKRKKQEQAVQHEREKKEQAVRKKEVGINLDLL